jgi:prepilin-type N-terminal cleavage/methylation domain-containing protein
VIHTESVWVRRAFTIVEFLVVLAVLGVYSGLALTALPAMQQRVDRADSLAKTRLMGHAVLCYAADHAGKLPPLFPGQVLEYREARGGRIVTECANYLGIDPTGPEYLVVSLLPRAYARQTVPANPGQMRVWVMNSTVTNSDGTTTHPFGRVTTPGEPPTGSTTLAVLAGTNPLWMMSTADQEQPHVAGAPWKANAPPAPPLGDVRTVFRFDGSAGSVNIDEP